MKTRKLSVILLGIALPVVSVQAQNQSEEMHKKALDVLRRTIAEAAPTPTSPTQLRQQPRTDTALMEMEQRYLAGRISAKQFQKYLQEHPAQAVQPVAPASEDTQGRALELLRQTLGTGSAPPGSPNATEVAKPSSSPQPGLSEIEAKMDELLRLKAAREKAAQENNNSSAPKTKRERLDELLRLNIQGKISDAEYQEKRSKIIAEKD